jgi:alkanesulfonate monooxygenase SsuD/methylene tetrahydromethanopterin reductase-like flavin-dependent oxidoreductase (luciferase family)
MSASGSPDPRTLHLAVDLTDAGAHPAAWRTTGSQARQLFDPERLQALVSAAQRGFLDFVLLDDAFSVQPGPSAGVQGRLDAALVAARLAPRSAGIGLVPTVTTTHTEPFHVSKAIATIDHVSAGRAGWQVAVSTDPQETRHFGRKGAQTLAEAWTEASEAIDVVTRLWDSWEDDAEIRDVSTGRFVDRNKLHYVDYDGVHFAVKGPSITPRPPQGHPLVVVRADSVEARAVAAESADVVRIAARTAEQARTLREEIREAAAEHGRNPDEVLVLVDAYAVIGPDRASAQARLDLLEGLAGVAWDTDSYTHVGTDRDFAATAEEWFTSEAVDGFTVRPSSLQTDLVALVDGVVPLLQSAGIFRRAYPGDTLRDTLGLARPANRYAAATA